MDNLLLLVACLLTGIALRAGSRVAEGGHAALNAVIIHVALPALALRTLHGFVWDGDHLWPVLMPWLLFCIGGAVFWAIGRWLALPRASVGALTLVGGLGNTSFVGLPMIESLHGRDGLGLGMLIDQLGSYLALSTIGVLVAAWYGAGDRPTPAALARRVLCFPPFVALLLALLLRPLPMPPAVDVLLARLGDLVAPLALLSVGLQLRFDAIASHARLLCLGLGYKLIACPALVVGVLWMNGAGSDTIARVSLIEAAMPPMIGAGIVAAQARLDAPLVATMIGVGVPLGLATASIWFWAFGQLGG
ncbi:MAG: AEC family transporter [Rubrivivax sp.]